MKYHNIWTLSEISNGGLNPISFELLAWGRSLADDLERSLCAVVLGSNLKNEELQSLIQHGADQVIVVDHPALADFLVRPHANTLHTLVKEYEPDIFLAAATTTGRTLMPYLSILVEAGLTADCTELEIDPVTKLLLQTRPAIGGNIMATIKTPTARPQMATVRPKSKKPLELNPARQGVIQRIEVSESNFETNVEEIEWIPNESGSASIEEAEVVVAGGRE